MYNVIKIYFWTISILGGKRSQHSYFSPLPLISPLGKGCLRTVQCPCLLCIRCASLLLVGTLHFKTWISNFTQSSSLPLPCVSAAHRRREAEELGGGVGVLAAPASADPHQAPRLSRSLPREDRRWHCSCPSALTRPCLGPSSHGLLRGQRRVGLQAGSVAQQHLAREAGAGLPSGTSDLGGSPSLGFRDRKDPPPAPQEVGNSLSPCEQALWGRVWPSWEWVVGSSELSMR